MFSIPSKVELTIANDVSKPVLPDERLNTTGPVNVGLSNCHLYFTPLPDFLHEIFMLELSFPAVMIVVLLSGVESAKGDTTTVPLVNVNVLGPLAAFNESTVGSTLPAYTSHEPTKELPGATPKPARMLSSWPRVNDVEFNAEPIVICLLGAEGEPNINL